jgi:hypothetical protein
VASCKRLPPTVRSPPARIVNDITSELLGSERGRNEELSPIDLAVAPEPQQLIQAIELTELVGRSTAHLEPAPEERDDDVLAQGRNG